MKMNIIISINPEHVENIIKGKNTNIEQKWQSKI